MDTAKQFEGRKVSEKAANKAESVEGKPLTEISEHSVSGGQKRLLKFKKPYFDPSELVEAHVLVAGETFSVHETFIQKLKRIKRCSAEKCNVILLFCPVVSRIGTDMEAAMTRVTEDKPVILVFMHHCHSPSHMTNIAVQPSGNIVKAVHCAFLETQGLLKCKENHQAVEEVRSELKKYKNKRMKKEKNISQESKHD